MAADSPARALALAALNYKESHDKGDYNEIANKPKLNGIQILGNHNSAYYKLPLLAETGHSITFSTDSEYNLTVSLLNKEGDILSSASVDLPVEGMVMDGHYKETSEGSWLVLTLQNGNEIEIPLDELIDELATKEYVDELYADVLLRIDSEAQIREEQVIVLNARLDSEAEIREQEDLKIRADLDSEATLRIAGDSELKNLLDSEAAIRAQQFEQLHTDLDSEAQTREDTDLWLEFLIDSEGNTRREQIRAFREDFDREVAARIAGDSELRADLNMEIFHRTQGDLDLQAKLDSEAVLRRNKDTELENALAQEAQTRSAQDIALSNRIDQKQDIMTASQPLVKLGNNIQLNYDPNTLKVEDNALKVVGGGSGTTAYLNGVLLDSEANTESAKIVWYGTKEQYDAITEKDEYTIYIVDDSEGTIEHVKSYNELEDKPAINGVTLSGDKSLSSFGIQPALTVGAGLSMANNTVSLNVRNDANNAIKIDTSNRVYADAYTKEETRMLFGGVFSSVYCTELPDPLSRNCFYLVGSAAPFTTFFVDSNGIEHYIGRLSPGQGTRSYIAGEGIDISSEGVISATGGGGSSVVPDPMDVIDNPQLDYSLYLMYTPSRGLYWAPQKK